MKLAQIGLLFSQNSPYMQLLVFKLLWPIVSPSHSPLDKTSCQTCLPAGKMPLLPNCNVSH